jgi:hypothetical protein
VNCVQSYFERRAGAQQDHQLTVAFVDPDTPFKVAVMIAVPAALAVANPPPICPLLIVTVFADELLQCADALTSCVVPSA